MDLNTKLIEIREIYLKKRSNGYLTCSDCNGYYELKDNESLTDFNGCECGSPLEYHEGLYKSLNPVIHEYGNVHDEYEELHRVINVLRNKAEERKDLMENLSKRIIIQEELLNEIKEQRWTLWDLLEEKNLQTDIKEQRKLVDGIIEQEDKLLSHIKKRRKKAKIQNKIDINAFMKPKVIMATVVMLIILIYLFI